VAVDAGWTVVEYIDDVVDIVEETPGPEVVVAVVTEPFVSIHPADKITTIKTRIKQMRRDFCIP
jgi:hypothetical protein